MDCPVIGLEQMKERNMLDADTPKGYDCQCCKKHHTYPAYVFAHWDVILTHKCEVCGATHDILRGVANMEALSQELPDNAEITGLSG
jgi:hypothetical protein